VSQATEGNSAGVLKGPPVSSKCVTNLEALVQLDQQALQLQVTITLADNHEVIWHTFIKNRKMYVEIPAGILPQGSKQSYVTLLEFAEELRCTHVVVCFKKDRADRAALMRMFMFLGLVAVPPGNPLVPKLATDLVFMAYTVEEEDCDSDG